MDFEAGQVTVISLPDSFYIKTGISPVNLLLEKKEVKKVNFWVVCRVLRLCPDNVKGIDIKDSDLLMGGFPQISYVCVDKIFTIEERYFSAVVAQLNSSKFQEIKDAVSLIS